MEKDYFGQFIAAVIFMLIGCLAINSYKNKDKIYTKKLGGLLKFYYYSNVIIGSIVLLSNFLNKQFYDAIFCFVIVFISALAISNSNRIRIITVIFYFILFLLGTSLLVLANIKMTHTYDERYYMMSIASLFWALYFLTSERVKQYFVE